MFLLKYVTVDLFCFQSSGIGGISFIARIWKTHLEFCLLLDTNFKFWHLTYSVPATYCLRFASACGNFEPQLLSLSEPFAEFILITLIVIITFTVLSKNSNDKANPAHFGIHFGNTNWFLALKIIQKWTHRNFA